MTLRRNFLCLATMAALAIVAPLATTTQLHAQNPAGPGAPQVYICESGGLLGLGTTISLETSPCPSGQQQAQIAGTAWLADINADGSIRSGTNFIKTVEHITNSGIYDITFTSAFPQTPDCIETVTGQDNDLRIVGADDGESESTTGITVATTAIAIPPGPEGAQYVDLPFKISCALPQ